MQPDSKRIFLNEYINLISEIGSSLKNNVWWTTWISSKNRFMSPIGKLLQSIFFGHSPEVKITYWNIIISFLKSLKTAFIYSYFIFVLKIIFRKSLSKDLLKNKNVYLIKTFSYAHSFNSSVFQDVFFGSIPGFLKESGFLVITIIDPIGDVISASKACKRLNNTFPYLAFNRLLDIPLSLWIMAKGLIVKFPKKVDFAGKNLSNLLHRQYQTDVMSPGAFLSLLMYFSFRRISSIYNASHLLLTFENNPWERMCILATRTVNPATIIIGYQHTVVPEASVNMFPSHQELSASPHPDKILTVGEEPKRILQENGNYKSFPIITACALRYQYLEKMPMRTGDIKKTLLVALEAANETAALLDYVLHNIRNNTEWNIIIRTHPALPFDKLKKFLKNSLTKKVVISKQISVQTDLDQCGIVIYWGSTVALEGLQQGIPAIHYDNGSILSFDPLFACKDLKWTVKSSNPLIELLDEIAKIDLSSLNNQRNKARTYLKKYFSPVTHEAMKNFL